MKTVTYTITGQSPLLMHSERLANPFDPITKAMKQISSKRKKTEDDLLEMARIEWMGGLYFDDDAGVHLPGYNIFAALVSGGKLHKLGSAIKRAALIEENMVPLKFSGPSAPDKLYEDKRFVDIRSVKVGTAKVARCRPIFRDWSATFSVVFDEAGIQQSELDTSLDAAGRMVGIGDYRPRFGRFRVEA